MFMFIGLMIRVSLDCQFIYSKQQLMVYVKIYMWRICLVKKDIDIQTEDDVDLLDLILREIKHGSLTDSISEVKRKVHRFVQTMLNMCSLTRALLRKSSLHHCKWHTYIGTGDASITGMITGGLWTIKGFVMRMIFHHQQVECRPHIEVYPLFQQKDLLIEGSCIVSIRIGQAIYTFLKESRKKPKFIKAIKGES